MSDNFESRIGDLAYELAKKDCNYVEKEDKDNQDMLIKILYRSDINKEIIKQQIEATYAVLIQKPNFIPTQNTRTDILNVIEQHLESGNLESITQINDKEFLTSAVVEPIVTNELNYREELSVVMEKTYSNKISGNVLTSNIMEMLRNGTLSLEKISELSNIFENTKKVQDQRNQSINDMINGTETEKEAAAKYFVDKEIGEGCEKHYKANPDNKSIRGVLFILARKATSNNSILKEDACLYAGRNGLSEFIAPDGTIDLDKVYERFKDAVSSDERLAKRFSTKEAFMKEVEKAQKRATKAQLKELSKDKKFKDEWNNCKNDDERDKLFIFKKSSRKKEMELFKIVNKSMENNDLEKAKTLLQELSKSDRHNIRDILNNFAKNHHLEEQLGDFVDNLFDKTNKDSRNSQAEDFGEK